MQIDELFDEYRKRQKEADYLLNDIAKEAQRLCMFAVYRSRRHSFYRSISEDEALGVFDKTFMECVERCLKDKTIALSGTLVFYYTRRLIDHVRRTDPLEPLSAIAGDNVEDIDSWLDRVKLAKEGDHSAKPEEDVLYKEQMKLLLDGLEEFTRRQRDMLILNAIGFSRDDIAYMLDLKKQDVNKGKFDSRKKLTKILYQEEFPS